MTNIDSNIWLSVITTSFNQGRFIRDNLNGALDCRRDDNRKTGNVSLADGIEHIVMDGGSADETISILKEYPHVIWRSEKDRGQTHALNKAMAMARGEWIAWVNSDDYLLPGAVEKLRAFIDSHPDSQFIYSNTLYVNADGNETERSHAESSSERFLHWWRQGVGFVQTGTFFRRSLWEKYGPFDESLRYAMDYDFWLKISDAAEFEHLDDWLVAYRLHESSKTGEGQLVFAKEMVRICRRHWDSKGGIAKWKYRFLLWLAFGKETMLEGIECCESGRNWKGLMLLLEGYFRNPLCVFHHPSLCFWARRILGTKYYNRLKSQKQNATSI